MDFGAGDGGFSWEQDPVKRREVARKILPAFSTKAIKAKKPTVQKYIDMFITKINAVDDDPKGVDLSTWLLWLAMDMSADLAYSREMHQIRDGTIFFGTIIQFLKKLPLLTPPAYLVIPFNVIKNFSKTFQLNSYEAQLPISKRLKIHLEQVALQLFVAEPEILDTLVEEVRSNFTNYHDITPDSLAGLRYLNACINETLRMHVATAVNMLRRCPGAIVDGNYVAKGTGFFTIARSPRDFHDPLSFRPARWLPIDHPRYEERFTKDNLRGFFPFGLGPRAYYSVHIMWYEPEVRVRFVQRQHTSD
ncbi:cytochrome P450 [Xylaria arbuscula]|nr:cytochrome P450 [Xylaria arbuscula]